MRYRSRLWQEKNLKPAAKKVVAGKAHQINEAFKLCVEIAPAKFDETVDIAFRLGIDPKHSDQQVRGAIALPNGLGKAVRVIVFAKGPKEAEAKAAGADFVGADDLVVKIQGGWLDFDKAIATPDMMGTRFESREDPGASWSDAEPENRYGHDERGRSRHGREKREVGFPRR